MPQADTIADSAARADRPNVRAAIAAPRIVITAVSPLIENGRFPSCAVIGQRIEIEADIFLDGHDKIAARVLVLYAGAEPQALPM